ncbi:hypothetical protein HaLaN_26309, partial [Haematococcus lacustris]
MEGRLLVVPAERLQVRFALIR